jgi:hypothetical protein
LTEQTPDEVAHDGYRIVAIQRADAPTGSAGRDWHKYHLAGHQHDHGLSAAKQRLSPRTSKDAAALNERRQRKAWARGSRPSRRATPVATPGENDES